MRGPCVRMLALAAMLLAGDAVAAPYVFRTLDIRIKIQGHQEWRNGPQWARTATRQRYEFQTTLRSTGKLEGANLLDPDPQRRIALKAEYLRRSGVAQIHAAGFDPAAADVEAQLSQRMDEESQACGPDPDCIIRVSTKFAPLLAAAGLPDNSRMFEGAPRYLFFFGYPACPNRVRAIAELHLKGEATRTGKKDQLKPFVIEVSGDSSGTAQEQASLCELFTAVLDTQTNRLQVENVYLPAARGIGTRTQYGTTFTRQQEVPVPPPLQGWVNQQMRSAATQGSAQSTLLLNLPLDGDSSVLGTWSGAADASLSWRFVAVSK